ncbi:MAG: imidazole glycerol phosphate synthase subunit HisH [Gemmatimonadota bacterium]
MTGPSAPIVCVLDYGSGNVRSVRNLFASLVADIVVSNNPEDIRRATHLVLPGVGAFGAAMTRISARLPVADLQQIVIVEGKPFLGICVGMQVLADRGLEFGEHAGLGWIAGTTRGLDTGSDVSIPHTGWNDLATVHHSPLLDGLGDRPDFYFVHSFIFVPDDPADVVATATHGETFAAVVQRRNIIGAQFHPEKSQHSGIRFARNFLGLP